MGSTQGSDDGSGKRPEYIQKTLFDDNDAPEVSQATKALLFHRDSQWVLNLGTIPTIGLSEYVRRHGSGDTSPVPVHDVQLSVILPLGTTQEQGIAALKELVPDYDHERDKAVVTREDRLVKVPRQPRGGEAAWGRRDRREEWTTGVTIELRDPGQVEQFLALAKQAPPQLRIETSYNREWMEGEPPQPNPHFAAVLAACGVDAALSGRLALTDKATAAQNAALKDHITGHGPTAGRTTR